MTDIDWNKAPEGATHWEPAYSANVCPAFVRQGGGWGGWEWFNTLTGSWQGHAGMSEARKSTLIPRPSLAWNGEGLPPVGTVCEYQSGYVEEPREYSECEIIAHFRGEWGQTLAAFTYVAHDGVIGLGRGAPAMFRPIRTPEQVMEYERRESIYNIALIMCRDGAFDLEDPEVKAAAELIYDAGYRKQEQPK